MIRHRPVTIATAVPTPQMTAAIRYWLAAVTFVVSLVLLVWALCFCLRPTDFHFTRGWNKWGMQEYDLGYCYYGLDFMHIRPVSDAEVGAALAQINSSLSRPSWYRFEPNTVKLSIVDVKYHSFARLVSTTTARMKFYSLKDGDDAKLFGTVGPPLGSYRHVHISQWIPPAVFLAFVLASGRVLVRRYRTPKPGRCPTCSYNLTGNTSGVCPECGAACKAASPAGVSPAAGN